MEADKRVIVVPVAARPVTSVDHHHFGVRLADQCVGERHAGGARTHDEIVRLELSHVEPHSPQDRRARR